MLVLDLERDGDSIVIGGNIELFVADIHSYGRKAKIAITGDKEVCIDRGAVRLRREVELLESVRGQTDGEFSKEDDDIFMDWLWSAIDLAVAEKREFELGKKVRETAKKIGEPINIVLAGKKYQIFKSSEGDLVLMEGD